MSQVKLRAMMKAQFSIQRNLMTRTSHRFLRQDLREFIYQREIRRTMQSHPVSRLRQAMIRG